MLLSLGIIGTDFFLGQMPFTLLSLRIIGAVFYRPDALHVTVTGDNWGNFYRPDASCVTSQHCQSIKGNHYHVATLFVIKCTKPCPR